MKQLILIRHAKSDWDNVNLTDFERPLSHRWEKEVKIVWKVLKKLELKTDLILCSSSTRTRETLEWIWEEIDASNKKIEYVKGIYDNHMAENLDYYLDILWKIEDDNETVVLIWHNTFITRLLRFLSWDDTIFMETLWVAILDFDIEKWQKIKNTKWKLVFFLSPKDLMS
jgi:phosphohistidine phosphatase